MTSRKCFSLAPLLFVLLAWSTSIGLAQDNSGDSAGSPSVSLGDAARKARAQKKDSGKPAARVFTNDDLGDLKGTISVIGNEPAPAPAATGKPASTSAADKAPAPGADKASDKSEAKKTPGSESKKEEAKNEAYWRAKFAAARKLLAQDTKELDILQREYNLKIEQFSQDPNWAMHEQYSRDDINKTQSEIETKKQDVEKDKQALSDLEDDLRKSGGEPGWANEPSGGSS